MFKQSDRHALQRSQHIELLTQAVVESSSLMFAGAIVVLAMSSLLSVSPLLAVSLGALWGAYLSRRKTKDT